MEAKLAAHPLAEVLTSLSGIGVKTAITELVTAGDATDFASAAHLAAYAGLAPVTRRSGSSIRSESRSWRGNRTLKTALYLSAFASLSDPVSRTYYDRKRAEGKLHQAALLCLAAVAPTSCSQCCVTVSPTGCLAPQTALRLPPLDRSHRDTF